MSKNASILYNFLKGPGFAPDLDRRVPNIIVSGSGLVPSTDGIETAEIAADLGYTALAATASGVYCAELLDGTFRLIAGTNSELYEATTTTGWNTLTRTAGGTYVGTAKWNFAQLGNVTLAANLGVTLQASPAAGSRFADVAGAEDFQHVEVVGQFAFGARTTATADVIRWSALGNYADWAPSVTTQAGKFRITSKPGQIVGIKALGENLIVYKKFGIYVGRYVGAPDIWVFDEVPAEVGASSHAGICNIGYAHFFMDRELSDVWMFDGSRPVRLNCPAIKWFVDASGIAGGVVKTTPGQSYAIHNKARDSIWFAGRNLDILSAIGYTVLAYNYKTNQWGWASYVGDGVWFQYASATDVQRVGFFNASTLKVYAHTTQTGAATGLSTGDIGDGINVMTVSEIKPLWKTKPGVTLVQTATKMNADDAGYSGVTATSDGQGSYHVLASSMWHRIGINWTGVGSLAGIQVFYHKDGSE